MKTKVLIISLMCFFLYNTTMSQQLGKISEFKNQDTCYYVDEAYSTNLKPGAIRFWYNKKTINGALTFSSNRRTIITNEKIEKQPVTMFEETEMGTVKIIKQKNNKLKFTFQSRDLTQKKTTIVIFLSERDKKNIEEFIQ